MKQYLILFFAVIAMGGTTLAQENNSGGMHFEHLPSWNDVLAKAKKENKMIFLDCYTTWCGPCKMMSAQVFTQKEVGDFYNTHFINAKVQLDTTAADNEYIKGWYRDGHDIAAKYEVRAFPTYLIFNSNGEIIHRFIGAMPGAAFIAAGQELLDPDNQYYTQLKKYESGDKSPQLLLRLTDIAGKAGDAEAEGKFIDEYLATQKDLYTKENIGLLYRAARSSKDKGFRVALQEGGKADKILGSPGTSKKLVKRIVINEEFGALMRKGGTPDFTAFDKSLQEKYPQYAEEVSSYSKMFYHMRKRNWNEFATYADKVVETGDVAPEELNSYAWSLFENTNEPVLLGKALAWSRKSLEAGDNAAYMDTYANLLHKTGKTKEAIEQQTRALEAAKKEGQDLAEFEQNLAKMKKGEPTW